MPDNFTNPSPSSGRLESVFKEIIEKEEQRLDIDENHYLESFPEYAERLREYFHNRRRFPIRGPDERQTTGANRVGLEVGSPWAGYFIEEELGRGGMGIVYRARQFKPERPVALKVIRMDCLESLPAEQRRQWLDRFQGEAQLVAALDRPEHIVSLYEVGEHEGQRYFTMRLVAGGTLAARLKQNNEGEPALAQQQRVRGQRDSVRLLASVARAVHYAHERGVLHRDLKPANILLDEQGQPLVSDFGLARRVDKTGSLVQSGIEGTAEYMSPEQARAKPGAATTAADIYSLGAILYECLTGRPPFQANTPVETLILVRNAKLTPPRRLNPRLDGRLETICLKCLQEEPSRRYSSAAALAEDLDNWLAGRPINAQPAGAAEKLWRWCRRNPVPATAAALIAATVAIAFVLISLSRDEAVRLADEKGKLAEEKGKLADEKSRLAEENEGLANNERQQKERVQKLADTNANLAKDKAILADEEHKQRKKVEWQLARETLSRGLDLCDRGETADGVLWLGRGLDQAAKAEAPDLERAARLNLAHWIPQLHTMRASLRHGKQVCCAAYSPDGRTLVTGSKDGTGRLWNAATGRAIGEPLRHPGTVWTVAFSPDGKRVVTGGEKGARLWDSATGQPLGGLLETSTAVWAVAFAADGRTLLTTSQDTVQLWETATGKHGGPALARGSTILWPRDVAFRPDGKAVVMTSPDQTVRLWDPATGKPIGQPLAHLSVISAAAFSSNGQLLLTGSRDGVARLWQVDTGKLLHELHHPRDVNLVVFGPDDRTLLTTAWDEKAWLWDAATGKLLATLPHRGPLSAAVFSPDSRLLLTGSGSGSEGEARLWDAATGSLLGPPLAHRYPVMCLAFSPDGRSFLTGNGSLSADYFPFHIDFGTAWLWQTVDPLERPVVAHDVGISSAAFGPDGKTLVTTSLDHQVRLWNAATGEMLGPPLMQQAGVVTTAFSPDGRTLVVGTLGFPAGAQLWNVTTGKPIGEPLLHARVHCVAFSPDGRTVLTAGHGERLDLNQGETRLWEAATGRRVGMPMRHRGIVYAVAWSRDGRTILTGSLDGTAQLWEAKTGKAVGKPLVHGNTVIAVAIAPDDKIALTGSADGTACLWNAATGERIGEPLKHHGPVVAVAFSPNGRTVLTGSEDNTARLWDVATGKPVGEPLNHRGPLAVKAVAFSPDGSLILTGSKDGTARLWEASTGLPVGPPWRHQQGVTAVAFSPDGRMVVTAGEDGMARIWKVPPPVLGPVPRIALWPEAVTGRKLDPDRTVRLLSSDEWDRIARQLETAGDIFPPPFDALDWHRREARSREVVGQWFSAAWHLGRLIDAEPEQLSFYSRRGQAYLEMRQTERAVADFSRAIERNKDSAQAWFERGHAHVLGRQWDKAVKDLSRAIDLDPNFGVAWHHRGYARAALGHWEAAAVDLAEAVKRPGVPAEALSHQALICLRFQDAEGYRGACRVLLQRSTPNLTKGRLDFNAIALATWTCAVGPDAGVDPRKGMTWYPLVSNQSANSYFVHRAAGAVLYRAGEFEAAIRKLDEALEAARREAGLEGTPTVWILLAMAEHRHGKAPDKARYWLEKARSWIASARKAAQEGGTPGETTWDGIPWPDRLALEQLEREASKLIEGSPPRK
jgi:WD40 repeat protein/tetratricopeptide (TPR) repeat protein